MRHSSLLSSSFLPLLALVSLTLAWLPYSAAQYETRPVPGGCPPGFDCVGALLAPHLGVSNALDCEADGGRAFAGYTCARPGSGADANDTLSECPSGKFCPTPQLQLTCPAGEWCHRGSSYPRKCLPGSACPEKTYKPRLYLALVIVLIALIGCVVGYRVMHWRWRKTAEQKEASSAAAPAQHVVQVKKLGSNPSLSNGPQPVINIEVQHMTVRVKSGDDSSSKNSSSSPTATAVAAASPGVAGVDNSGSSGSGKTILHDISGTIRGGRLTAIMGPSGAGQATMRHTAALQCRQNGKRCRGGSCSEGCGRKKP